MNVANICSGLPHLTDSASPQSADAVLGYEAFQYGPNRASWSPGFYQGSLPEGVTRYITNGAGVSAPSENLGFYFSGMRSPDWGPIYYEDSSANVTADTLIQVDMSVMRSENWTNTTLPDNIPSRANAELVWIPVSEKGVLVAIGGVLAPEEIWAAGLNESQTSASEAESPSFMTSLPVYDIASSTWYLQNTTGDAPGQLTQFCSVVATANDSSSFNVYIYGGYDGLNAGDPPSDDVWILSIPSFQWIKAYSGTTSHGRSGHRCVTPYPDQMLVVGGVHQNQANCVEGGIIQVFNLNKLEFQNTYDADTWSEYAVPSVVSKAIGGNAQGGSSKVAAWSDGALSGIFTRKYSNQITHYYPYQSNGSSTDPSGGGSSGVSKSAIIGISVAAGLIFLLAIVLIILLVRRRHLIRSGGSEKSSHSSNSRISRWLDSAAMLAAPNAKHNQSSHVSSTSPPEVQQAPYTALDDEEPTPPLQPVRHEMAGTERPKPPYELATPYNSLDHPRHSGIVDYAYSKNFGHTHSNSQSRSTSSTGGGAEDSYRPSPLSNSLSGNGSGSGNVSGIGNGDGNGNGNITGAAAGLRGGRLPLPPASRRQPFGHDTDVSISSPSHDASSVSSNGTTETLAWPFPATQNTWRGGGGGTANNNNNRRFGPAGGGMLERERSSESSSVQPIIEEPEEEYHHPERAAAYRHPNDSVSSGIGTLPSPGYADADGGSMPHDDEPRRSLFDAISPVSPTVARR